MSSNWLQIFPKDFDVTTWRKFFTVQAISRFENATIRCPHHHLRQSCPLFASHYWVQKYKGTYIAYKTEKLQLVHIDGFALAAADARQKSTNVLGIVRRRTIFLPQEATNNIATRGVFKREKRNNIFFFFYFNRSLTLTYYYCLLNFYLNTYFRILSFIHSHTAYMHSLYIVYIRYINTYLSCNRTLMPLVCVVSYWKYIHYTTRNDSGIIIIKIIASMFLHIG